MGCSTNSQPIVITATFPPPADIQPSPAVTFTPNNQQALSTDLQSYVVQPGDTLSAIAVANDITVDLLLELNQLTNPDLISVGQTLQLPSPPTETTPLQFILPNGLFVRGEASIPFDTTEFILTQPGYIRIASDTVSYSLPNGIRIEEQLSASEIIDRVSREYSIDPRLLLTLLEYRGEWLSNLEPNLEQRLFPLGVLDERREGLYQQLTWAADRLNRAYYGWRYDGLTTIQFNTGERLLYNPTLNGATVAIQYLFSLWYSYPDWLLALQQQRFVALYTTYFGQIPLDLQNPVPTTLSQPVWGLPFDRSETWFFTGGPHGGWGSGSAWAAIDIAPPDERQPTDPVCYTSAYPARALTDGILTYVNRGVVILDADGDEQEETGWSLLYLHVTTPADISSGKRVTSGDIIGYPSCEGGFSNATHLHIARRYNGEWIPADCTYCPENIRVTPFTLAGWQVYSLPNQEYQGGMNRQGVEIRAEQGRLVTYNRINW